MTRINLLLTAVVLFACIPNLCSQDWPQYLGPNRNSTSPQKDILRTWPASGPEVLWTTNVGPGFGMVGPMFSFAEVHPAGKMLLFFCMWIGRLEVVTALVLLVPEFWKK